MQIWSFRRQRLSKRDAQGLALYAALSSVIPSIFAVGFINARFHWFPGKSVIWVGAAYVLVNAVIRGILRYQQHMKRQEARQHLQEMRAAAPPERNSPRRFRYGVGQNRSIADRIFGIVRLIIWGLGLYAAVTLLGLRISLLFALMPLLVLLITFAWQRRFITRFSKSALIITSVTLFAIAVASQIYLAIQ